MGKIYSGGVLVLFAPIHYATHISYNIARKALSVPFKVDLSNVYSNILVVYTPPCLGKLLLNFERAPATACRRPLHTVICVSCTV